jgi:hypothetical protein
MANGAPYAKTSPFQVRVPIANVALTASESASPKITSSEIPATELAGSIGSSGSTKRMYRKIAAFHTP